MPLGNEDIAHKRKDWGRFASLLVKTIISCLEFSVFTYILADIISSNVWRNSDYDLQDISVIITLSLLTAAVVSFIFKYRATPLAHIIFRNLGNRIAEESKAIDSTENNKAIESIGFPNIKYLCTIIRLRADKIRVQAMLVLALVVVVLFLGIGVFIFADQFSNSKGILTKHISQISDDLAMFAVRKELYGPSSSEERRKIPELISSLNQERLSKQETSPEYNEKNYKVTLEGIKVIIDRFLQDQETKADQILKALKLAKDEIDSIGMSGKYITPEFYHSLITRFGSLVILFFTVQFLGKKYEYLMEISSEYSAIADAIELSTCNSSNSFDAKQFNILFNTLKPKARHKDVKPLTEKIAELSSKIIEKQKPL